MSDFMSDFDLSSYRATGPTGGSGYALGFLVFIGGLIFSGIIFIGLLAQAGMHQHDIDQMRNATVSELSKPNFGQISYHYEIRHVNISQAGDTTISNDNYGQNVKSVLYRISWDGSKVGFMATIPENGPVAPFKTSDLNGGKLFTIQGQWSHSANGPLLLIESAKTEPSK